MAKTRKSDFQDLADARAREAKVLQTAKEYDGAYYLAGYSIECALKACIIKKLNTSDECPEKNFANNLYSHRLAELLKFAGLDSDMKTDIAVVTVQRSCG